MKKVIIAILSAATTILVVLLLRVDAPDKIGIGLITLSGSVIVYGSMFNIARRYKKSSKYKGKVGETTVKKELKKIASRYNGYVINDVIVQDAEKKYSQIDHILFVPQGVFVIETKNYEGAIYGDSSSNYWTQVLAGGRMKNKFYSPLMQNTTHVKRVRSILGCEEDVVKNCIVFVKGNIEHIDCETVCMPNGVRHMVELYDKRVGIWDYKKWYQAINEFKTHPVISKREYVKQLKKSYGYTKRRK